MKHVAESACSSVDRRSWWLAAPLLCLLGCASRAPLPAPCSPLIASPDAPFRARPPALPAVDASDVAPPPEVESATLSNGLTVWVVSNPALPYVALSAVLADAGTFDAQVTPELVQLTARAVLEGGMLWTSGDVIEPPRVHGEPVRFAVYPTHTRFDLRVMRSALQPGLTVLARTLRYPTLADADLDAVRLRELNAMQAATGPSELMLRTALDAAYGSELASRVVPMRKHEVLAPQGAAVRKLHETTFVPNRSALIAVGDVTLSQLLPLLETELAGWQRAATEAPRPRAPTRSASGLRLHFFPSPTEQAHVLILQSAPSAIAPEDELPYALMAHLAVGTLRSRANTVLRHEGGLTYGVRPQFFRGRGASFMTVEASFELDAAAGAIRELLASLARLQTERVSQAELVSGSSALLARYEAAWRSNPSLVDLLGQSFAEGKDLSWLRGLPARLAAITSADVQRVARRYLSSTDVEIGVTGDSSLAAELSFLGRMEVYQLEKR